MTNCSVTPKDVKIAKKIFDFDTSSIEKKKHEKSQFQLSVIKLNYSRNYQKDTAMSSCAWILCLSMNWHFSWQSRSMSNVASLNASQIDLQRKHWKHQMMHWESTMKLNFEWEKLKPTMNSTSWKSMYLIMWILSLIWIFWQRMNMHLKLNETIEWSKNASGLNAAVNLTRNCSSY